MRLDPNWMARHGVPTVTFGIGQSEPHTIDDGSIARVRADLRAGATVGGPNTGQLLEQGLILARHRAMAAYRTNQACCYRGAD
jgi:hypothetical protein